jgi:hypothetical protein
MRDRPETMPKGREQRGTERKIDTKQITLHQKCDSASGGLYKKCNLQTRHDEKAPDGIGILSRLTFANPRVAISLEWSAYSIL